MRSTSHCFGIGNVDSSAAFRSLFFLSHRPSLFPAVILCREFYVHLLQLICAHLVVVR